MNIHTVRTKTPTTMAPGLLSDDAEVTGRNGATARVSPKSLCQDTRDGPRAITPGAGDTSPQRGAVRHVEARGGPPQESVDVSTDYLLIKYTRLFNGGHADGHPLRNAPKASWMCMTRTTLRPTSWDFQHLSVTSGAIASYRKMGTPLSYHSDTP